MIAGKIKFLVLSAVLPLVLMGCVSADGNKDIGNAEVLSQIKPNESTKADVRARLGPPTDTTYTAAGQEIWKYTYMRSEMRATNFIPIVGGVVGGADTKSATLTILWHENDTVQKVSGGSSLGGGGGLQDADR